MTIRVIYQNADDLEKRVCEIKPKGWIRKQNEIVWNFQNVKPTQADNMSNLGERGRWFKYNFALQKEVNRCSPTRIPDQTEIDIAEWEE